MPFEIVRNDLNDMHVDAAVRVVDVDFELDLGVERDGYIKLESTGQNDRVLFDDVVIVPACNQKAKYVIYVKRPVLLDGHHDDDHTLASCYQKALKLAYEYHCESIAFPLISSKLDEGLQDLVLRTATQEIRTFLLDLEMQIYLVIPNKEDFIVSQNLFDSVSRYIDDNYDSEIFDDAVDTECVDDSFLQLNSIGNFENLRIFANELPFDQDIPDECGALAEFSELGELLQDLDAGFSETLLKLIDRTGKKDSEIYKKANVDRKLFSKIRNNSNYQPSKRTAIAFAFALELDLEETEDFIGRAGYRLSHSNKFDVIIEYFLIHKNYNVFELNEVLFAFDQPLVGA